MTARRLRRWAATAVAVGLAASGCSVSSPGDAPEGGPPTTLPAPSDVPASGGATDPATDPALAAFYEQQVNWQDCGDDVECTDVTVPVDWERPGGGTLDLAVVRRPAGGERLGSLVMNPGGPGGSGVDFVTDHGTRVTTRDLRDAYDLVGFDPRGVGGSEPVDCLTDREMDAYFQQTTDPDDPAAIAELREAARDFAAGCEEDAGELLGHVDTESAARDMDVLRAALGEDRLDYLGLSYGTLLGATYADLFPGRVGRMVLDGAMDPSLSFTEVNVGQARGMEQALRAYVEDCVARGRECPLRGDVEDGLEQVRSVLEAARERPLRTGDPERPLSAALAVNGVIAALYDQASWAVLDEGLKAGLAGDGSVLLRLADAYSGRDGDGAYATNLLEVFNAVNCLDHPVDASPEAMAAAAERLTEASPTFGWALAYGEVLCDEWPVPPVREPAPLDAEGAPPILVVGTTGDPATPYEWAEALTEQLDSARLLTWEAEGHTAYMSGSACIDAAVDGFLVDGVLPGEGATCRR